MKRWMYQEQPADVIRELSLATGASEHVSRLLLNRGIDTPEEARLFLYGDFNELSSPYMLLNMGHAVEMIEAALQAGTKIVVYGDYDVDGICSTVLLAEVLEKIGAEVSTYIPSRLAEGYGLNTEALEKLMAAGTEFVITVDNGIAAADILQPFLDRGLKVLVTDHHQLPERLPNCPIVNPQLETDERAPYRHLCGCGVAFMLAKALLDKCEPYKTSASSYAPYLELVALATIADIVPLRGDNRLLVAAGLKCLKQSSRPGLRALADLSGIDLAHLRSETVSFQLAPRLNAAGRLDRVSLAIELLQCRDTSKALALAEALNCLNGERKDMENQAFLDALAQVDDKHLTSSIVVWGETWHAGVIGIVASRLVDAYGVPAIVLTANENDSDVFSGSGRAPDGFDLFSSLTMCSSVLIKYGGHEKAAGLSVKRADLKTFKEEFDAFCVKTRGIWYGKETQLVDEILLPSDIDDELWSQLACLEPTGCGNPKPRFVMESIKKLDMRACGQADAHLQLFVPNGGDMLRGIAFRQGEYIKMSRISSHDLLFHINKQTFRGEESLELIVDDIRPSFMANNSWDAALFLGGRRFLKKDGYEGIGDSNFFYTKVVGVSFENRQEVLRSLSPGMSLTLRREPENPCDGNAIAVVHENCTIGYLKRELSLHLAPLLDHGTRYAVQVAEVTGGQKDQHFGVNITLEKKVSGGTIKTEPEVLSSTKATDVAQYWLGHQKLHQTQKKAFDALTAGENTLVVMGTGRGKSLIYQAMAVEIASEQRKLSIVFFPLRALLNDQYLSALEKLSGLGISVMRAFGELNRSERDNLAHALQTGHVDVVLTTPEFFLKHETFFRDGQKQIGFFVFDEAHHFCSRRSGYRDLSKALTRYSDVLRLALTATVPNTGGEQMLETLDIHCVLCDANERGNLKILDHRSEKNKSAYLLELCKSRQKTVVYVNSRKQAWLIACQLRSRLPLSLRGTVGYYHGGLSKQLRNVMANAFASGQIRFLIATTAFGEGMHIPDIRHVVLYHLCFSIESYNQLAGRAGRDGETAFIHLLYGETDRSLNEIILETTCPERPVLAKIYQFFCKQAAPNGVFVPEYTAWSKILKSKLNKAVDEETLHLAIKIFVELGFIERVEEQDEATYCLKRNPPKRSLQESSVYLEGASELDSFRRFEKLAFEHGLYRLSQAVRKPLCPAGLLQRGGDCCG